MNSTRSQKWSQLRAAFTLMELLVVIAILALLVAMLSPMVSRGIASGQETVCRNNLKQLAMILMMIRDDHKKLPTPASMSDSYFGPQGPLLDALEPYLSNNPNVLFCPRSVRLEKLNIEEEFGARRIGYFYWAWKAGSTPQPLYPNDTVNVWLTWGWNNQLGQLVLLTDRFRDKDAWSLRDDWQFHAPRGVEQSLSVPGTLAVLGDGSVHKIAPRPP